MTQNDIQSLGSTRIAVGLSQVIKIIPQAYQYAMSIKILSGGGTLEIVNPQLSGTSTASGATAWGTGYPIGASESVNVAGPAVFYLVATGATMVAAMYFGNTAGATLL